MNRILEWARREPGDWMSPIVVKELRQGLQNKTFVGAFVSLQVIMLLLLLAMLNSESKEGTTFLEFLRHIVPVLIPIIPAVSGARAISDEIQNKSLELLYVTHLTAWRIVFGKWLSLFVQAMLIVVGILPYTVLRYFLGDIDLLWEGVFLISMVCFTAVSVAATIATSSLQTRVIGNIVIGMFGYNLLAFAAVGFFSRPVLGVISRLDVWTLLASGASAIVVTMTLVSLLLEFAAGRIAPAAENHAIRQRLILLAFLAMSFPVAWFSSPTPVASVTTMLVTLVVASSLAEEPNRIRSIHSAFVRRGRLAAFAGRFLVPGWPSGLLFAVPAFAALTALWSLADADRAGVIAIVLVNFTLLPYLVLRLLPRPAKQPMVWFIFIHLGLTLLNMATFSLGMIVSRGDPQIAFAPAMALSFVFASGSRDNPTFVAQSLLCIGCVLISIVQARRPWSELRARFAEVAPERTRSSESA